MLTAVAIQVTAYIAGQYGWRWALASMAVGPMLGIWAMTGLLGADDDSLTC